MRSSSKNRYWILTASLVLAACSETSAPPADTGEDRAAPPRMSGYAIRNVNVVPMDSDRVLQNQTVLVSGGEILSVAPTADGDAPAEVTVIDGAGKYLAPGLADMHAHPMTQSDLDLFLANGITFIRSMWGEPPLLGMRREIEAGERLGPRIDTAGRIVDGAPVIHYGSDAAVDAATAADIVTRHEAAGYDWIKVYSNLSPEAFAAIANKAAELDIPFAGHIPAAVPAEDAFRSGMLSFEHLTGVPEAVTAEGAAIPARWDPAYAPLAISLGKGETGTDSLYDPAKLESLANLAAETGIYVVPTMVVLRGIGLGPEQKMAETGGEYYGYMSYPVQTFWKMSVFSFGEQPPEYYAGNEKMLELELGMLAAFHRAGARILAGTDAPNPFTYVGFSLVNELEYFVRAGMTPYEALQTATSRVAEFLGEEGRTGVVTAGARADLVLLDENPLEDVAALRAIRGVMVRGQWLDRAALDGLLDGVKARVAADAAVFGGPAGWPLEEGEQVVIHAEYRREKDGVADGAERISTVQGADGATTHISHRIAADGAHSGTRLAGGDGLRLSGSAADWLAVGAATADMADGERRELEAVFERGGQAEAVTLSVSREAAVVVEGHFYWSGCNPYEVTISGETTQISARLCMGGGFYTGWPISIEVDEGGSTVRYTRFL